MAAQKTGNEASANQKIIDWLQSFDQALRTKDINKTADHFEKEGYWRDLVAFTWNIKTLEGQEDIKEMLSHTLEATAPHDWQIDGEATESDGVVESCISFNTKVAKGYGYLRLRDGKAWTLLTTMVELRDFPEKRKKLRPKGAEHGVNPDRLTWQEKRDIEQKTLGYTVQPYCLVIGGGQGGIGLGARLRQLEVPTIVIDKQPRPGDTWRNRYKSLCLHDPVWYDHMPYIPFPENWPVFTPKDKVGDWLEMYTKVMELNYWGSTECISAEYDEALQQWNVEVDRDGERLVLNPKQLVLATGMSGLPNIPEIPGMEDFAGEQHHSSQHPGGEAYKGKKCIVLGANNSSHDICAALWESGADVTMIQR